ncbi:hypothetical protein BCR43DRAFT_48525 [Syncephalastrum racemosum]|uniref:Uncharacterized protein n=1 Tax=Syncephalastrum racemosum TaxID=13706 RepID=A0A1X2HV57_SYNRA|nr:hypothetical protein BCR43DRAFT_48525 [Syncephalastrum racemosum]
MLATKLLTAVYLVGLHFTHYSTTHKQVCKKIHDTINAAEASALKQAEESHNTTETAETPVALPADDVEDAFMQLDRYQTMSHRERADAQHAVPTMRGRGRRGGGRGGRGGNYARTSINPNFNKRQRISSDKEVSADTKQEDDGTEYMEVLKPYLEYKKPTVEEREKKAAEERQMWGPPGSLMWLDKMRERRAWRGTYHDDFGGKTAYAMKGQWHYGQREFTGCLPDNEDG